MAADKEGRSGWGLRPHRCSEIGERPEDEASSGLYMEANGRFRGGTH